MSVFKVNWKKLAKQGLPTFLRRSSIEIFLFAAFSPLKTLWEQFDKQREETELLLKYSMGKRDFELVLCKKFGEGIYISNTSLGEGLYLKFYLPRFMAQEGYTTARKKAYTPQYLPFPLATEVKTDDFYIYVPRAIYMQYGDEIFNYAGYFALPGFQYKIIQY